MVDVYDSEAVRVGVQALMKGHGQYQITNDALDRNILQALRRLSRDVPRPMTATITGTGKKFYQLAGAVTGWVDGVSTIISLINPTPVIADDDDLMYVPVDEIKIETIGSTQYMRLPETIEVGKTATLRFTGVWTVSGIDEETVTTLTVQYRNALEFATCALVCVAFAVKSAGTMDDQFAGDIVNWRTKEAEYRRIGREFESQYFTELGIDPKAQKPIIVTGSYDTAMEGRSGLGYITH